MSPLKQKQSAIARLLKLVNEPRDDYRPSTDVFLELNIDVTAADLRLAELGAERGASDRPASDAQGLDDVEHRIVERIENHKQDAHKLFLDHLHTYDGRLAALDFEERFTVIRQEAPAAVSDFNAEASLGRGELFFLRHRLADAERERAHFKEKNKLIRAARISTMGWTVFKVGLLAVMFVFETAMNGGFLSQSNEEGYLGGAIQAVSFAGLNILASFGFGFAPIRLLNLRNLFLKLLGFIGLLAYIAFAIGLNLTLAHLREMPPTIAGHVGHEVMQQLLHAPHVFNDVNSWVFFGIGFIFSLIAMADGVFFKDPFPGYGATEKRWLEAGENYTDRKAELTEDLRDIRDTAKQVMNDAAHDLSVRRSEFDSILQARARLAQRFAQHQNHIERAANALLTIYRECNRKARKTPAPAHFSKNYEMERILYTGDDKEVTAKDELRRSIKESQEILEAQIAAIHRAFDEAVKSYREIDELIPEKKSAAA